MQEDTTQLPISKLVGPGYNAFWNTKKFFRLCKGAKGSKKSKTCALWYIWHMMQYPEANTLVVRRIYSTIRDSCYTELLWAINRLQVAPLWKASVSPLRLTYIPTGQVILFKGLDDATKVGSLAVDTGYLCWVWIEEFFEVTDESEFEKLQMSIRGGIPPETGLWKQITCTFNPWSENSWIKARFFDEPHDNVFACTTTYRCNNFLDEADFERYDELRARNPRAARVICDGEWGIAEGLVYTDWEMAEFDYIDILNKYPDAKPMYGLDFGFITSYTAFVAALIDVKKHIIWVFDEMYERGISNLEIAKRITKMGYGKEYIIADSAEPKSIFELQEGQIEEVVEDDGTVRYDKWQLPAIRQAMKGPDSVRNGVRRLQSFHMIVHPKCKNYMMELNNYCFDQDKDGKTLDKPIKDFDHLMDAVRMASERYFVASHGHVVEVKGGAVASGHKSKRVFASKI